MTTLDRQRIEAEAIRLAAITGSDPEELMELAELGFAEMDKGDHFRLIASTSAREKEGKTHFAIATAPEPIAYINTDEGDEGVVSKFPKKKIIEKRVDSRQKCFLENKPYTKDMAEKDWEDMQNVVRAVVKSSAIRTMVFDTATDVWEIARLAKHGRLKEVMPHEYSELNAEFRAFAKLAYQRKDLNVVFIHKVKKEYTGKNWNGGYERQGFSEMGFIAQVNVEHFRVDADDDEDQPFGIRVVDSRHNSSLVGEELVGPMCSFVNLARLVHPKSKADDWK